MKQNHYENRYISYITSRLNRTGTRFQNRKNFDRLFVVYVCKKSQLLGVVTGQVIKIQIKIQKYKTIFSLPWLGMSGTKAGGDSISSAFLAYGQHSTCSFLKKSLLLKAQRTPLHTF